jgi:putative tryptophan/tyrosine transport system substrate-binding protein
MGTRLAVLQVLAAASVALAACWPTPTAAEKPPKMPRVAVAFARIPMADLQGPKPRFPGAQVLLQSLSELGWNPGKDVEIVWRSAEGNTDLHDSIMEELASLPVSVIAVSGNPLIRAAMRRTRTIPIVMITSTGPVESGLVATLAKPGGNVTGIAGENSVELNGKRLALLKQVSPQTTRVAFIQDRSSNSMTGGATAETHAAAAKLGIRLLPYKIDSHIELEAAVADAVRHGANGMFVDTSLSAATADQAAFHALARRHRLATMHTYANAVTSGGLMFYGTKPGEQYRRAAFYIHRILAGGRPSDMPVEQPSALQLILNLQAARDIGLEIPAQMLAIADEVRR